MNHSRLFTGLIVVVGGMIVAMMVIMEVLVGGGNNLANLAKFLSIGGLIMATMNGKLGLYWLIILFAYGDMIKRLMVIFGRINILDVTYVLSIAPLVCSGVVLNYFIAMLFGRLESNKRNWSLFWICAILTGGSALYVIVLQNQGILSTLKSLAHQSIYIMLVWVFYVAAPTRIEIRSLMRFTVIVFIPVAIYGIYQGIFGLNDFELDYLATGLSIEMKYLREGVTHAFSTMSSAKSFGIVMALCCAFVIFLNRERGGGFNIGSILLVTLFLFGSFFCMKRAAWLVAIALFTGIAAFGSRMRTVAVYTLATASIVLLIAFSGAMLQSWSKVSSTIEDALPTDSQRGLEAFRVSTFSARLIGLRNLATNPAMWSWFGVDRDTQDMAGATGLGTGLTIDRMSSMLAHDALSKIVLNYGIVTTAILGLIGIRMLFWFHSLPHRFRDRRTKKVFVVLLAGVFAGASAGVTSGTFPFPINAFIFMLIAVLLRLYDLNQTELRTRLIEERKEAAEAALAEVDQLGPLRPQFARSFGASKV